MILSLEKDTFSDKELEQINYNNKNFDSHAKELNESVLYQIAKNEKIQIIKELLEFRVYAVLYKGEEKILKIIDSSQSLCISETIDRYNFFSKLDITPKVHIFGFFYPNKPYTGTKMYGYIITDYIPLTLHNIKNKREQEEAIKQAIALSENIEDYGYYNIDNHGDNYLWDFNEKKAYAIDFADLVTEKTEDNIFDGTIRNM